jgi:hypothetical protein
LVNGNATNITVEPNVVVGPHLQTPYGYWKGSDSSQVYVRDANFQWMENTNYNYTCKAQLSGCSSSATLHWETLLDLSPNPSLVDCKAIVTVPFEVTSAGLAYCNLVQLVSYPDNRDSVGLKAIDGDCAVNIKDTSNTIFPVWLSTGTFRWFRNVQDIGCVLSGDGLYNSCSGSASLVQALPKVQSNDVASEIIVTEDVLTDDSVTEVNIGTGIGDALAGLGNGLASVIDSVNIVNDFMDNIKQVIIIVVIAVSILIAIIIVVVVICCIANRKEIWKNTGAVVEKFVDKDVGRNMRHVYDDEEPESSHKHRKKRSKSQSSSKDSDE